MNSVVPRHTVSNCLLVLFLIFFSATGFGQLRIGARLGETRYLKFERVELNIVLENNTGNDLVFDYSQSKEAHLSVYIKKEGEREPVQKRALNALALGTFRLAAGQRRDFTAVLNSPGMFSLQKTGVYQLWVQAGHPRLASDYRTQPMKLEIRSGTELWSTQVGVPAGLREPSEAPIQARTVSLLWFSGSDVDHYALRIEDDKQVYSVLRLGQRISGEAPVCQVDALSNTHVLIRVSSKVYAYKIFNYRGKQLQVKLLAVSDNEGPPTLVRDRETGVVRHLGGREARQGKDYELLPGGRISDPRSR